MIVRPISPADFDRQQYNSCVHFATNGSLYGYDWYLNNTAREWDLIVEGDPYVTVMPLPRREEGLAEARLFQPVLLPELAVYSVKPLSPKRIQAFWEAIPEEFTGGGLTVEPASVPEDAGRFTVSAAPGTALVLDRPIEGILDDFPPAYFSYLALAHDADLKPASSTKPERLAAFWRDHTPGADDERFHAMQRLMYQTLHRGWGGGHGIEDADGKLLASAFIAYSHGRLFPLFVAESAEGKQKGALTLLFDYLLRGHAGQKLKIKREDLLGHI